MSQPEWTFSSPCRLNYNEDLITSVTFAFSAAENEQTMLQLFSPFLSLENREVTSSKIHSAPIATADCKEARDPFSLCSWLSIWSINIVTNKVRGSVVREAVVLPCQLQTITCTMCAIQVPDWRGFNSRNVGFFLPLHMLAMLYVFSYRGCWEVWGQARHGWGAQPALSAPQHSMKFLPLLSPDQQPPLPNKCGSKGVLTAALLAD